MADMSRRSFVKMGAAASAGILAFGSTAATAAAIDNKSVKYDEEYDVVIIGSGYAAMAAGVTAAEKGLKVCVVEKMGRVGGNSVINGGLLSVVDSPKQKAEGVKDSVERYMDDSMKAGRNINHIELIKVIGERGNDALNLTLKCGAKYVEKLSHLGGHSVPRTYWSSNGSGSGIMLPMIKYYQKLSNATLKKRTKFDDFVTDESGRVVGVSVREKYKFDKKATDDHKENKSGKRKFLKAKKGVILASGGFCRDVFYRNMQDPRISKDVDSTNQPGATGEVMLKAFELGAIPVHVGWLQFGPWACPDEKAFGVGSNFNINAGFRYGISVDPKTGKRYMNELADRRTRADAMFKVINDKEKNYPINFCDQTGVEQMPPELLEKPLKAGIVKKFNTIAELAKAYGIPVAELEKTVKAYNGYVKAGKDPEHGKPVDKIDGIGVSKAPFYAIRGVPKLHHTMGGLKINTKAQVISSDTKEPIPGLYAAGEITGGTHGASRLGSCSIPDCLVFGMVAAENI